MKYDPKDASDCLPEGSYDAELYNAEEKTSKAGNEMIELTWSVPYNGRIYPVRDWIVNPSTLFKLKGIARAWQMLGEFEGGTFAEFLLEKGKGRLMRLELTVQTDPNGKYQDRNNVKGYVEAGPDALKKVADAVTDPSPADHIPF